MRWLRRRLGLRIQLLALFGLLLLTGATVLVLDEVGTWRSRQAMDQLKDESLDTLRRIKAVSDAYGMDLVDTAFRVRNGLMGWEQGLGVIDNARVRVREHWRALQQRERDPRAQVLFAQATQARIDADRAAARLREILAARDLEALAEFCDREMYPAIDPVTTRLRFLSDLAMISAEEVVRADVERARQLSVARITLSLVTLLVVAVVGRAILRNVYKGVESLTRLAGRMRRRDFSAAPGYRPHGELGEVMGAFLALRADILKYETELNQQLERNEQVRRALEYSDDFQRTVLAAAQTAIVALDARGRYTHVNPFAERLLGYRAVDMIGADPPPVFYDASEIAAVAAELTAALDREVPADWRVVRELAVAEWPPREWTLVRSDGARVPVLMATSPLRDDAGALEGVLVVATDLSMVKELEHELRASEAREREANRAKSAFLAAMSHEIRTPMIGVTGMVEILSHTRLTEDQRRALSVIQHSAESLLQIIGDILDFSKIEAGKLELAPVAVDLRRLVASVTLNFLGSASSKGLALRHAVDDGVAPAYRADALRLRQILSNFLSNAVKFTEDGGIDVELEVREAGEGADALEFRVRDTGIGVSTEQQARLFQPFAQAEPGTTQRFGGTGLGLSICRRLAELMGGRIAMDSAPGRGTTMRLAIELPHADPADIGDDVIHAGPARESFRPRPLPTIAEAEAERSLVLLADDHPTNRLVIARQLGLAGFQCETAEDGQEALERWRSGRYALVLSDVHMPGLDGYQLARTIRAEEAREGRARTPIVAITAAALKGEAERCLAAGMDDYLAKPVGIPTLVATLHRWLPHLGPAEVVEPASPEPALPQATRPPPLDPAALGELAHDPVALREVLEDFIAACRGDLEALAAAASRGDLVVLGREAHKIKGAARLVGATELAGAADAVEQAARAGDWATVREHAPDLETSFDRIRLYLAERASA